MGYISDTSVWLLIGYLTQVMWVIWDRRNLIGERNRAVAAASNAEENMDYAREKLAEAKSRIGVLDELNDRLIERNERLEPSFRVNSGRGLGD